MTPLSKSYQREEAKKPSYRSYVEAQSAHNPCLRDLNQFIVSGSMEPDQQSQSHIHALEFSHQSILRNSLVKKADLEPYLRECSAIKEKLCGRVLVVENPSVDVVEILGSGLDINPLFFASHIHAPSPDITSQTPQSALLPSQLKALNFVTHHYHKTLSFEGLPSPPPRKLFRDAHYPRKVVLLPPTRGARIGIAQHCCSILQVNARPEQWFYLVLVDPPITNNYIEYKVGSARKRLTTISTQLFQGGYEDFQTPQSIHDDIRKQPQLSRWSMLDDLIYYWTSSPPLDIENGQTSMLHISCYPFRIIAAEWVKYVEVMSLSVKQYEYQIDDIPDLVHTLERFDSDLKALQSWRRRTVSTRHKLDNIIQFITNARPSSSNDKIADLLLDDYKHLAAEVDRYGQLLQSMLPVVTSLVQIVDSRRSFAETANISRLTYLALAFVPLSFISSLFSMSGDLAPGGTTFWVYFVVAIPLVGIVFALARVPLDKLKISWMDLKRRRFGLRRKASGQRTTYDEEYKMT